jgi:hypothetical protein
MGLRALEVLRTTIMAVQVLHNNSKVAAVPVRTASRASCLLAKRSAVSCPKSLLSSAAAAQDRSSSSMVVEAILSKAMDSRACMDNSQ